MQQPTHSDGNHAYDAAGDHVYNEAAGDHAYNEAAGDHAYNEAYTEEVAQAENQAQFKTEYKIVTEGM